ncbi:MAG: precorrin-2 dehydrogenase/sirohydrochlorin ferrochelatase family protein [Thermodesulfobacteriota bacterium]
MKTYPLFALIEDRPCLVVGGGAVGERKVQDLLTAGARVTVVSQALTPRLMELAAQGGLQFIQGDFSPHHLDGMTLVVGATDDQRVNREVSAAAQARHLPVNIVDAPELCTFIVPAQVRRGSLTIAVSTGGASPALARQVREDLEQHFGPEYGVYLRLLQGIRTRVLARRRGHEDNPRLFQRLVASPLREALTREDRPRALALLEEVLGQVLPSEELAAALEEAWEEEGS